MTNSVPTIRTRHRECGRTLRRADRRRPDSITAHRGADQGRDAAPVRRRARTLPCRWPRMANRIDGSLRDWIAGRH